MLLVRAAITFAGLFVSLALGQESGELVPSNLNSENIDLNEIRNLIDQVRTDSPEAQSNGESINSLQRRIQSLEKAYEDLTRKTDSLKRENQNSNITATIQELQIMQTSIQSHLKSLSGHLTQKLNEKTLEQKVKDIVLNIKANQFGKAKDQISQLDSNYIPVVVQDVYDYQSVNFDTLIAFCKFLKTLNPSFVILNELWKEMKRHGHFQINNLLNLHETISSEVVNQTHVTDDMRSSALTIRTELLEQIKTIAMEIVKKPILDGNYEITESLTNLIHWLSYLNENFLDDIQRNVIDDVFDDADKAKLVDFMCFERYSSEIIVPAVLMFQKLRNNLNHSAMMNIGRHLKWALDNSNSLSAIKKNSGQDAFNELPKTVQTLFSGETICIAHNSTVFFFISKLERVIATTEYDSERRKVETTSCDEKMKWQAEYHYGSTFAFVNANLSEYMYAAEYEPFYEIVNFRRVFTYKSGKFIPKAKWIIELYGNEVMIRNEHFNEYLCYTRPAVYTSIEKIDPLNAPYCRWTIESCPMN